MSVKSKHGQGTADSETLRVVVASDSPGVSPGSGVTSSAHGSIQTNATGATWQQLSDQACSELTLINNTGTAIEVRRGGAGTGLQIPDGTFWTFEGLENAEDLEVRRVDQSNTQVTLYYEYQS